MTSALATSASDSNVVPCFALGGEVLLLGVVADGSGPAPSSIWTRWTGVYAPVAGANGSGDGLLSASSSSVPILMGGGGSDRSPALVEEGPETPGLV